MSRPADAPSQRSQRHWRFFKGCTTGGASGLRNGERKKLGFRSIASSNGLVVEKCISVFHNLDSKFLYRSSLVMKHAHRKRVSLWLRLAVIDSLSAVLEN